MSQGRGNKGMRQPAQVTILGGGPAGLAVGYYARKRGIPFTIHEARARTGGNCVTLRHGDFLFDSGAHRWHDKNAEATDEIKGLLGGELRRIEVPSLIYYRGKHLDFPLSPLNLMGALGARTSARAALDVARARIGAREPAGDFEAFAVRTYGRTLADRFLLNYSGKLWGKPCRQLSPRVSGARMKGLTLKTFVKEALLGSKAKTEHMDGSFYYPRHGIGAIPEALSAACGGESIRRNSEVTRIFHDATRITAVEINGRAREEVGSVVSTLPLDRLLGTMDPGPPAAVRTLAGRLCFRNVVLVSLFLNRESVTDAATLYFPEAEFPFTRMCEPRNRSACMSPAGKTSLVLEAPCGRDDAVWTMEDGEVIERISLPLFRTGMIERGECFDGIVTRMPYAYPVLETGYENTLEQVTGFLKSFGNLALSGRCGRFAYVHLHDLMQWGREIVDGSWS